MPVRRADIIEALKRGPATCRQISDRVGAPYRVVFDALRALRALETVESFAGADNFDRPPGRPPSRWRLKAP